MFAAQDYGNFNFNYTPLVVVACFFVAMTVPLARFTDWLQRRDGARAGGCPVTALLEVADLRKSYGDHVVLEGVDLTVNRTTWSA